MAGADEALPHRSQYSVAIAELHLTALQASRGTSIAHGQRQVVGTRRGQIHIECRWLAVIGVVDTRQPSVNCGVEFPRPHRVAIRPAERYATGGSGIKRAGQHVGGSRRVRNEILGAAEVEALLPTRWCG